MLLFSFALAGWPNALDPLGTDRLEDVAAIRFTFQVARGDAAPSGRSWVWRPADGTVTRTIDGEALTFRAGHPTSDAEREADAQFVNDGFWLVPHLHFRWAAERVHAVGAGLQPLPVGEGTARHLMVRFPPEGGYTPGDGYDLFVQDGRIVAWSYRPGGGEPTLTTSFEGYVWRGPLQIATDHRTADGSLRVTFVDVDVALADGLTTLSAVDGGVEGPPFVVVRRGVGCRVGGHDVPERDGPDASSLPDGARVDGSGVRVRRGERVVDAALDGDTLALVTPGLVGASGFARCDLRGLGEPSMLGLLRAASPTERALVLSFALGAWLDDAPVGQDRIASAARTCASTGACDEIVGLLAH